MQTPMYCMGWDRRATTSGDRACWCHTLQGPGARPSMIIIDSISALLSPVIGSRQHHQGKQTLSCRMLLQSQAIHPYYTLLRSCYCVQTMGERGWRGPHLQCTQHPLTCMHVCMQAMCWWLRQAACCGTLQTASSLQCLSQTMWWAQATAHTAAGQVQAGSPQAQQDSRVLQEQVQPGWGRAM
jgi:hypothetical protein